MNNLRQMLRAGETVLGSWINTASPIVAELMAASGFDFLTIDAEHSAVELPQAQALMQAIRSGSPKCAPLVRLAGGDYAATKRFMDAGAAGVIAPLVNTAEQATEIVRAVRYPPEGGRGVGFCRDNGYGATLDEAVKNANDRKLVCVQIEHITGVENIDEILSVEGVDAAFIGPYDLSASMGETGRFDSPRMLEAKQRILTACAEHKIAAGIHVVQPNPLEAIRCAEEGYRLIAYSLDITMLMRSCENGLREIRQAVSSINTPN